MICFMTTHTDLLNKCIKRAHLNLSAECGDLCCPMWVVDEFAGSVVAGETNNMLEWDVVHEVLFIEAILKIRFFLSYIGK